MGGNPTSAWSDRADPGRFTDMRGGRVGADRQAIRRAQLSQATDMMFNHVENKRRRARRSDPGRLRPRPAATGLDDATWNFSLCLRFGGHACSFTTK